MQRDIGGYWGMVKRPDEAYGRLLDAVQSMGLAEDTIVVFTTDHGEHFSTRNPGEKRSCHEASIRTPCVLTGPGFFGGGTVSELTSILDLPPTLLDASGIPVPESMQGRSILTTAPAWGSRRLARRGTRPDLGAASRARPSNPALEVRRIGPGLRHMERRRGCPIRQNQPVRPKLRSSRARKSCRQESLSRRSGCSRKAAH